MADRTPMHLRNQVMYSVFVRQFSPEGTFKAVQKELPRLCKMGVDILWLLPIHPIGEKNRKGTLGSPYAIRDYRAVNPELGTLEELTELVQEAQKMGMKCIIDVVYNHTSPDSVLAKEHPEWFYHRPDGSFGNRIGDWTDIIDLDYSHPEMWEYQIETLCRWAKIVDGFRCDVAPLIPIKFWLAAREAVEAVRPGCLWLSESVEPSFILENREHGIACLSDAELYRAFDLCYDYDVHPELLRCLNCESSIASYAEAINRQEAQYPQNYGKLRFLENHDRPRAAFLIPEARARRNWTAFSYFQKGTTLLYNGQEAGSVHRPSLFEKDPICWLEGEDISETLRVLHRIKQAEIFARGAYRVKGAGHGILIAQYAWGQERATGVFSTEGVAAVLPAPCPDGAYRNEITGQTFDVEGGLLSCAGEPILFRWTSL